MATACTEASEPRNPTLCIWITDLDEFLSRCERIHLDHIHSDLASYDKDTDGITPRGSLVNLSQYCCQESRVDSRSSADQTQQSQPVIPLDTLLELDT